MFTLLVILHIFVSIFLIIVVLLQAGKGASIGAAFGGSSQTLFGGSGPATFLGKLTAVCAIIFMLTSLSLTYLSARRITGSIMEDAPVTQQAPDRSNQGQTPSQQESPLKTP